MRLRRRRHGEGPGRLPASLLLALALSLPAGAWAEMVEEGTRIAAQAGWRYAPNGGFVERARALGTPLLAEPTGGPSMLLVFGYRVGEKLEIAAEIGWAYERFRFEGVDASTLTHVPLLLAARWYPWRGELTPYLGAGMGYYLNFISGGIGSIESHTSGPFLAAGLRLGVGERVALVAEARGAWATAELGSLGGLRVGGVSLLLGAELSFPPEKRELDLR